MFNNPFSNKPRKEDYPLPDLFRAGSEDNKELGELLETGAIIGSALLGAYKLFGAATEFNEIIAQKNARNR